MEVPVVEPPLDAEASALEAISRVEERNAQKCEIRSLDAELRKSEDLFCKI